MIKRIVSCLPLFIIFVFYSPVKGQDDIGTLKNLLKDLKSPNYEKAWTAAQNLAKLPLYKTQIVPTLIEAINHEWNKCSGDVRQVMASSLAELKAKEAVFPLLELIKSGKKIGHECAECGCCFLALTPGDEIMSRGYDPFCENRVLWAINEMADVSHSKAMADIVSEGKWKPELLITIGKVGLPRYAYFISRYKDDKEVEVRKAVALALGQIENDDITIPVLIQLLSRSDEDFFTKWEASSSLIQIGKKKKNQNLKKRLLDLLTERDKISVALAARTLAALGEGKGLLKLREMAADEEAKVRLEAVMYLGEEADAGSKEILIKRLKDESLAVRGCAIYALGRTGDPSIIPILKKAFEDANDYQKELKKKLESGVNEKLLREKYGFELFDLRQTLQEAIDTLGKRRG